MGQYPVTDASFSPATSSGTYVTVRVRNRIKLFLVTDLTKPASYAGNSAAKGFTGVSTTSAVYVSTGFGSSITIKNGGIVYLFSQIGFSMTGGTGRVSFQIYKSTVGIPNLNVAPPGGDSQVTSAETNMDVAAATTNLALPYLGYDGFPGFPLTAGVKNFYYLCFKTSAFTLNLQQQGQMFMIEP